MANRGAWGRAAAAVVCGALAVSAAWAQGPERASYDFEDGVQGFVPFAVRGATPEADAVSTVSVTMEKDHVRSGSGALVYKYQVEPGITRMLALGAPIPKATQSLRFWVKSAASTTLILNLREKAGVDYALSFYVPADGWVPVSANLDELIPGDAVKDRTRKPDTASVEALSIMDMAMLLVNASGDLAKALPDLKGQRTIWVDDLQFSPERLPRTTGAVTEPSRAFLVDNFETETVRWVPVKIPFGGGMPKFEIFPTAAALQVRPDAAPPGVPSSPLAPGGKGLRYSYNRAPQEAYALIRSLEKDDLSRADRLRLSINLTRKSLVVVQIKEKDDSEYNAVIMPDESVGWHNLELIFTELSLGENSKDENNALDPNQIKELNILDASSFLQLEGGDTSLEIDALSFGLK